MKSRTILLAGAAAIALLPAAAQAQDFFAQGPYVGIKGGYMWSQDVEINGITRNEFDFEDGWAAVVEGGFRMNEGLRVGVEIGYSSATVGDIAGGLPGRAGGAGDLDMYSYMAVLAYELNAIGAFRPYVSVGGGMVSATLDDVGDLFLPGQRSDDRDEAWAWQAGAGVALAVSPNIDLTLGYRFMDTAPLKVNVPGGESKFDYQNHTALVGLRYTFGAPPSRPAPVQAAAAPPPPPPPPPPPAAPAISRNFTVFFDFDRATLTQDAQQVLQNVARDAQAGRVAQVRVEGHADTSGPADYNRRLSERRAQAVQEYLAAQGVSPDQIQVAPQGEENLLVPTADGVREPSNRRAVIIFPEGGPTS